MQLQLSSVMATLHTLSTAIPRSELSTCTIYNTVLGNCAKNIDVIFQYIDLSFKFNISI